MSTWYFIWNVDIPPGTELPCEFDSDPAKAIDDENHFLGRVDSYPGFQLNDNGLPDSEMWELDRESSSVGELTTTRRPVRTEGFPNPFLLAQSGMDPLEALETALRFKREGQLIGLSIRAHPRDVIAFYDYMKLEFPGLLISEEDSPLMCDRAAFVKLMRELGWEL